MASTTCPICCHVFVGPDHFRVDHRQPKKLAQIAETRLIRLNNAIVLDHENLAVFLA
jgi:hypothetical protein